MRNMIFQRKGREAFFMALAAIALGAVLTSCGGGGDEDADASSLTKPQFIKQANGICQAALEEKEIQLLKAAENRPTNAPVTERTLELMAVAVVLPIYKEAISKLGELEPPAGDEDKIGKLVDQFETALRKIKADPTLSLRNSPFQKPDDVAEKYGLEACTF